MENINATEAQRSFGQIIDRAHGNEAIVVERYGRPRVVILEYERYTQLVSLERDALRARLRRAAAAVQARAGGLTDAEVDRLLDEAREEVNEGQD